MEVIAHSTIASHGIPTTRRFAGFIAAVLLLLSFSAGHFAASANASGLASSSKKAVAKRPAGALKLPSSKVKTVNGKKCGLVKSSWLAGTSLKGGYFLSFAQQSKNYTALAKKAKKKTKAQKKTRAGYLKQAKSFAAKAKTGLAACNKKPATPVYVNPNPTPTPPPTKSLTFALKGTLGVGVSAGAGAARVRSSQAAAPASNLVALLPDGSLKDAIEATPVAGGYASTVRVSKVLVGPDNKLYVLFASPTSLGAPGYSDPTKPACYLAQVDRETGVPTCIDTSSAIWGGMMGSSSTEPIQFDSSGAIYYLGQVNSCSGGSCTSYQAVRRWKDGSITNVVGNANTYVQGFVVMGDGTVLFQGQSFSAGGNSYLRKFTPVGETGNIGSIFAQSGYSSFLAKLPDGNAYIGKGWSGSGEPGLYRYMAATNALDTAPWIARVSPADQLAGQTAPSHNLWDAPFNCNDVYPIAATCPGNGFTEFQGVPQKSGDGVNDSVYVVSGYNGPGQTKTIIRIYPGASVGAVPVPTGYKPTKFVALGDKLLITGTNAVDEFVTWIHNTTNNSDVEVFPASDQHEVFTLGASPSERRVYFSALKFTGNSTLNGYIDLDTNRPVITQTTSSKIESLALFH